MKNTFRQLFVLFRLDGIKKRTRGGASWAMGDKASMLHSDKVLNE